MLNHKTQEGVPKEVQSIMPDVGKMELENASNIKVKYSVKILYNLIS